MKTEPLQLKSLFAKTRPNSVFFLKHIVFATELALPFPTANQMRCCGVVVAPSAAKGHDFNQIFYRVRYDIVSEGRVNLSLQIHAGPTEHD